jgi:hypothetical protein
MLVVLLRKQRSQGLRFEARPGKVCETLSGKKIFQKKRGMVKWLKV